MSVGSLLFSDNYLSSGANSCLDLTGDFTVDFFVKCSPPPTTPYVVTIVNGDYGMEDWCGITITNSYRTRRINLWYKNAPYIYGIKEVTRDVWNFITIQRSGTTYSIFLNGVLDVERTLPVVNVRFDIGIQIGRYVNSESNSFVGNLSNLRIVKGHALYTSNFTPPTTSLTNVPGTVLLLRMAQDDPFVDSSPSGIIFTTSDVPPVASELSPVTYVPPDPPSPPATDFLAGVASNMAVL